LKVSIRYVQSNKKKISRNSILPPEIQMHIMADRLCKRTRDCRDRHIYHKLPANEVNFILNDYTINANVAKASTIAYHSISMRQYMKDKYNWTNQQLENIWWKPQHRSMGKLNSNDLVRIQKFIFNYLPTNKRKSLRQASHRDTCETCEDQIETENHMLRCESEKRYELREKWIEDLEFYLSKPHTPREVKDSILTCVTTWLNNEQTPCLNNFDRSTRTVIREQNQIGWDHFMRGRLVISWEAIIKEHLRQYQIKNTNAEQWAIEMLNINWKHILAIWNQRNKETLGDTEEEKQERQKNTLIRQIQNLQQKHPNIPQTHRDLIDATEETLVELTEAQLAAYLHGANIITKIHMRSRQIGIRKYLLRKDRSELDPGENK
jgi:hypothetical protein